MKAVLVINKPKNCYDGCDMYAAEEIDGEVVREYCYSNGRCFENIPDEPLGIPSWCQLRDLPDYKPEHDISSVTVGQPLTKELITFLLDFGFNCCLDMITGEDHYREEDD